MWRVPHITASQPAVWSLDDADRATTDTLTSVEQSKCQALIPASLQMCCNALTTTRSNHAWQETAACPQLRIADRCAISSVQALMPQWPAGLFAIDAIR